MTPNVAHTSEAIRSVLALGQLSATEAALLAFSVGLIALITVIY